MFRRQKEQPSAACNCKLPSSYGAYFVVSDTVSRCLSSIQELLRAEQAQTQVRSIRGDPNEADRCVDVVGSIYEYVAGGLDKKIRIAFSQTHPSDSDNHMPDIETPRSTKGGETRSCTLNLTFQ